MFSFPKNTGMVYSLIDATFGFGYTLGPVIGAFLYNLGGFLLPFLVSSLALMVSIRVRNDIDLMVHYLPGDRMC